MVKLAFLLFVMVTVGAAVKGNNSNTEGVIGRDITHIVNSKNNTKTLIKEYTKDEVLANIKKNLSEDRIIKNGTIYEYKINNPNKTGLVYVESQDMWVDIGNVTFTSKMKREPGYICYPYTGYNAFGASTWYSGWCPSSSCLQTGYSNAGGSEAMNSQYTWSTSESTQITADGIASMLNVMVGLTFEQSWTVSNTVTCNVNAGDNVQIWSQHVVGSAGFQEQACHTCSDGSEYCDGNWWNIGSQEAPVGYTNGWQYDNWGCSSGSTYQCAYGCSCWFNC